MAIIIVIMSVVVALLIATVREQARRMHEANALLEGARFIQDQLVMECDQVERELGTARLQRNTLQNSLREVLAERQQLRERLIELEEEVKFCNLLSK